MTVEENDQFKMDGKDELNWHEDKGEMDLWSEKQSTLPSKIDKIKGLTIEMTFEYPGVDGAKKNSSVKIEWDERTLAKSDVQFSVHNLMTGHWNPKKISVVRKAVNASVEDRQD